MSDTLSTSRWRPTRAGIRNIWEYDDQIFEFVDGRLILRGPNGSGKSNALALLVPYLLDGVMAASRMDSLGGGRSMKTLLLCLADDEGTKRFRHEQRTGYVWLEFERGDEHLVIGCGARASAQREAEAWFFVTTRRPGIDLDLAPGNVPLSKGALTEQLGTAAVYDSAESYRSVVDRALFGLGIHRYRNLLELLLVLRRPHLAGKLNLDHLSKVLGDGLAALDDQLIADVAASFDDLEAVQRDLRRLEEADRSVQRFQPVYRRYLRSVARARAVAATDAVRALRGARRRVTEIERNVALADGVVEQVRLARVACEDRREVAEQRRRAVLESPGYRDAKSLVEVEERTADAQRGLDDAQRRLSSAETERQAADAELGEAKADVASALTATDHAFTTVAEAADLAGVGWPLSRDQVDSTDLAVALRSLGRRRRQDIADVRAVLSAADKAAARAKATSEAAVDAAEEAERREADRRSASDALDHARSVLVNELRTWVQASGLPELKPVVEAAGHVGEPVAPSLADVVGHALRPRREALAARDVRADDRAAELSRRRDDLRDQRQQVADDPVPAPDRLPTRPADRSVRAGAPLYACCDFADHVQPADRAGLEAAIEAAGFLDAWLGEPSDDLDTWLRPLPAAAEPTLADVLVPTPPAGSGVTAEAIGAVLSSVSLADAGVAVLPDGTFHLGPLTGRFAKPEAEFIGATAREQRRQRLLAELDQAIAKVTAQLEALATERASIAGEIRRLDDATATLPSAAAVLGARDTLLSAIASARTARETAARAESMAQQARKAAEERLDHLRAVAADRQLPTAAAGLDEAEDRVHAYEQQATVLAQASARLTDRRTAAQRVEVRVTRAEQDLEARRGERDTMHRDVGGLRARVEQLRSQLGADAQAPVRELAAIEDELQGLRAEAERLSSDALEAARRQGVAQTEQTSAIEAVAGHESAEREASTALDVLRREDVWAVVADQPPAPTEAAELAAAVVASTSDVSGEADDNALQRAYRQLLDELGRGYDPSLSYIDHVAIVEVTSDAGTFSVLWLAQQLREQVARQRTLLSERDREIFEHHLLTRVSEALRELLNDADELVERINISLAHRPTASGKSVQLRWEPNTDDPTVRAALGLLRKSPELLGPDERKQLHAFFSTAIAQRRAEDATSGYAEILSHVLDYRSWHGFVPWVRSAGGGLQRLTRTLYRSLSGGEQAVVLHLPLFAAAAAHYDAAAEGAPRLIALDEAFAGIDEGMRAELMGLLVRFDLDILLTGHELWGAYEQVPSLMVYDLLRQPPLEGVSAFAVRWDGAVLAEV